MDKNRKGILLTDGFELAINVIRDSNGMILSGMTVGSSIDQDAVIVLNLHQGDLKEDPLLGPGLTKFIRGKYDKSQIDNVIKQHFTRAGIDYDDYKDRIQTSIK